LIARELVETVRSNTGIDRTRREDVRARLRIAVKRLPQSTGTAQQAGEGNRYGHQTGRGPDLLHPVVFTEKDTNHRVSPNPFPVNPLFKHLSHLP